MDGAWIRAIRRFQSAKNAGLTAAQVPNLKLKWAFGVPTGLSQYNQPTIVSGRVFLGTDTGYVYSLDAKTGCVYWSFQTKAAVRGALSVGPVKGKGSTKYGVFFGDFRTLRLRPGCANRPATLVDQGGRPLHRAHHRGSHLP